jgi:hypothetical protein
VTTRDHADREQPFNLRIAGTTTQTVATNNSGQIYDIRYLQFMQADQLRGLTFGTTNPVPGRRVLAKPLHDVAALGFNLPTTNGPAGAVRLGDDGSQAVFLPARHAMTHQLTDAAGNPVVRERYWLTYQPGEIRTCTSCHGINNSDQAGHAAPTNKPQALRDLLRFWKTQTGYSKILSAGQSNAVFQLLVSGAPNRTNILEATTDWNTWQGIGTNNPGSNGVFWFSDPEYPLNSLRFYRLRLP